LGELLVEKKQTKIVTHAGQAHADEVLAIALIMVNEGLAWEDLDVVRAVDGRARDWPDADFVVDVGRDHDPRRRWFDHHQFPRDASPACSFTLVARHYGVDLNPLFWSRKLAVVDSRGPMAWVTELLGRRPRDSREFSSLLGEGDSFMAYLADVASLDFRKGVELGKDWLSLKFAQAAECKAMLDAANRTMRVLDLGKGVKAAWFDTRDPAGVVQASSDARDKDPAVVVSAMRDDRGAGYAAYRIDDDERVDFGPLQGQKGCLFVHNTGFCMKFKDDWEGFLDAVRRSVKDTNGNCPYYQNGTAKTGF
jgi:hypothetical protein